MAKRSEHTFQFKASDIADAARSEAEYHEQRIDHWATRRDKALEIVTNTISAKVVERPVTGGVQADVVVDYGDTEAWREYSIASGKVNSHRAKAEAFRTDERVYGSQSDRVYELDTVDVQYFRLGGEPRED